MYERNIVTASIVSAADLTGKEGYAVDVSGALTSATGDTVYGVVRMGRPAGEANQVVTAGEVEAYVTGTIAAGDPLTGGASGALAKATIGTHLIRAIALEANASGTNLRKIMLL